MLNRDICESHVAEAWKGCDVEKAALGLPQIEDAIRQLECPAGGLRIAAAVIGFVKLAILIIALSGRDVT